MSKWTAAPMKGDDKQKLEELAIERNEPMSALLGEMVRDRYDLVFEEPPEPHVQSDPDPNETEKRPIKSGDTEFML